MAVFKDKSRFLRSSKTRGIALIIVLVALVLLTVLVLVFLTGIGSELQSSKLYANGSSVKLLAQSSVALVMGEVQAATADQTLCWASQPGMIRTYKNDGTANGYYKLYSDGNMSGSGAFDHTIPGLVPDGTGGTTPWYSQAGVYIDLNQPIYSNGTNYYPIIDGNSADYSQKYTDPLSTLTLPAATSTISSLNFNSSTPVGANGLPAVTGFWLNSNTPVNSASPNVAPMPVKWLYVLQNGEVIVPDSNPSGGVVNFKNTAQTQPSSTDPIVGRMAFWTDDETSKVNINTASEGTAWDTPRSYSQSDYSYAMYQPVQNEFQRYPGHPATVSLSAVFNGLTADAGYPENFYPITPRVAPGGSKEGTVSTAPLAGTGGLQLGTNRLYATPDEFLFQPKLASGAPGTGTRALNYNIGPPALANSTELDQTAIEKAKFFITSSSEAPDVNVFNLPRVSMWPITLSGASASATTAVMTPYDQLIAFCSTIGGNKFYFQRWDPTSSTNDLPTTNDNVGLDRNRQLMEYLRTLTSQPIPGFGGSFSAKYGTPGDRDQILTEMFDYVRSTNLQDSSTGAKPYAPAFSALTAPSAPNKAYTGGGVGQVVPIQDTTINITDPVGSSSGSNSNNPRGFGRFPTIQQACLVFIGAGNSSTPSPTSTTPVIPIPAASNPNPVSSYTPAITDPTKERVQAAFFFQMYDPSEGVAITRPSYQVKVTGLNNLLWNGQSIFPTNAAFPYATAGGGTVRPTAADAFTEALPDSTIRGYTGLNYGGMLDFRYFSILRGSVTGNSSTAAGGYNSLLYPFISPPTGQTTPAGVAPDMTRGGTFNFTTSGDVTVQIYALSATGTASSNPIQTISLKFPAGSFPVPPSINNTGTSAATNPVVAQLPSGSSYANYDFLSFIDGTNVSGTSGFTVSNNVYGTGYGRLDFPANSIWVNSNDVIRGIVASDPTVSTSQASAGDVRLIAARQYVPDAFFQPISGSGFAPTADYTNSSNHFSHMLRILTGFPVVGSIGGGLAYFNTTINYSAWFSQYLSGSVSASTPDTTFTNWTGSGSRPKDPIVADPILSNPSSVMVGNNTSLKIPGDWDNGIENSTDGAYINKADEGDTGIVSGATYATNGYPYFELDYGNNLPGATFFSPNRMIPSPGMFGSLPSGVWADKAWQTLLFRPGPANHPGLGTPVAGPPYITPPDHLFMDLFNMPVVEPYAISTPLATAGRINMNYLIVPFTYINRDTALRAAMKNQMVSSIPIAQISKYKLYQNVSQGPNGGSGISAAIASTRYSINLDSTLSQFLARFYGTPSTTQGSTGKPDIFHSASEICDIDLVPSDTTSTTLSDLTLPITRSKMDSYWAVNGLTGDNSRERPYANLYPLLTTKSNTFTVHFRVQTLKQALPPSSAASAWQSWREGTDIVTSENRGSETIERYVDPNATSVNGVTLPDYASSTIISTTQFPPVTPLSSFYKFRVVSSRQFPP